MCKIVDNFNVILFVDMVYIFGLVVAGEVSSSFDYVDVVIMIMYKFF